MYQVDITFKEEWPSIDALCKVVDNIFGRYKLPCVVRGANQRAYSDSGDPKDYGRLFDCISEVADSEAIVAAISEGYWINGEKKESLMDNFFRQ